MLGSDSKVLKDILSGEDIWEHYLEDTIVQ
jgi:hypothetical protein